jgi:hypothetical protein
VDHFKVSAIMQGKSGLPEDRFVNTFFFRKDTLTTGDFYSAVTAQLRDFYFAIPSGASRTLASFMSGFLEDRLELRFYDLGQQPPREPHIEQITDVAFSGSNSGLPLEVALCLSYYADRNLPRQRGRIYLGPFNNGAAAGQMGKPAADLIQTVSKLGPDLLSIGGPESDATWVQLSRVAAQTREVTAGWVDNAFDTQRRRGEAADARTTWS